MITFILVLIWLDVLAMIAIPYKWYNDNIPVGHGLIPFSGFYYYIKYLRS